MKKLSLSTILFLVSASSFATTSIPENSVCKNDTNGTLKCLTLKPKDISEEDSTHPIYKYKDKDGNTYYSDELPTNKKTKAVTVKN
jgi:hypothetical protein